MRPSSLMYRQHPNFDLRMWVNEAAPGWKGGVGFITTEALRTNLFPPSDDVGSQ